MLKIFRPVLKRKRKSRIKVTKEDAIQAANEYIKESQIHGFKVASDTRRKLYEKDIWITLVLASMFVAIYLCVNIYLKYSSAPTATNQLPTRLPVGTIKFPAVAVCSGSRISKEALMRYAEFVFEKQGVNHTFNLGSSVDEVFEILRNIGAFYEMEQDMDTLFAVDRIHTVLSRIYNGSYPIISIMNQLTPKCSDTIKRCKWGNRIFPCEKLFETRVTFLGLCCVFNYQRERDSLFSGDPQVYIWRSKVRMSNRAGAHRGLTVVIDQNPNDFAYSLHSMIASKILVFEPANFPDRNSGAVSERVLPPDRVMELSVTPIPTNANTDMKKFAVNKRKCVFNGEKKMPTGIFYSLSECLLSCRMQNLIKFCGCYPPYTLKLFNVTECQLTDLTCLARWREQWFNYEPLATELELDHETNQQCPDCISRCNFVLYRVATSWTNLRGNSSNGVVIEDDLLGEMNLTHHSVLNVFYSHSNVIAYQRDTISDWAELLSKFGGICGLFFGASVISIIEVFYYATGKFFLLAVRQWRKSQSNSQQGSLIRKVNKVVKPLQGSQEGVSSLGKTMYWSDFGISNKTIKK